MEDTINTRLGFGGRVLDLLEVNNVYLLRLEYNPLDQVLPLLSGNMRLHRNGVQVHKDGIAARIADTISLNPVNIVWQ